MSLDGRLFMIQVLTLVFLWAAFSLAQKHTAVALKVVPIFASFPVARSCVSRKTRFIWWKD